MLLRLRTEAGVPVLPELDTTCMRVLSFLDDHADCRTVGYGEASSDDIAALWSACGLSSDFAFTPALEREIRRENPAFDETFAHIDLRSVTFSRFPAAVALACL